MSATMHFPRILRHALLVIGLALVSRLPAQTLLSYYSFDSDQITTVGSFITGATGTGGVLSALGSGPTVDTSGRFGGAANFSSGGLDTPSFAGGFSLSNDFSISFWLKTADVTALANSYVFQVGGTSGGNQNAVLFGYAAGKTELYGASAVSGDDPRGPSGITLSSSLNNTWVNIAYTYNTATLRGYLNGVEVLSTPMSSLLYASGGLSIGSARNGAALVPGSLDDVAIWRGALSPVQVAELQTSSVLPGSAVPEPSTYAAICGGLMLGIAAWRRRTRSE
jgi:hypothetical protein